ncbi:MAG: CRISPR system precrRNA processing endoribonuclease RAMP protein Cas6, partial [Actinobacteria bacterium]|nr:CRISPR system precrRNA processing endoribonuclease RAMP protein Cas6 [Actinomycetota bacterium]
MSPPELLQAESYRDLTGPSVDVGGPAVRLPAPHPTTFRKGQRSEPLPTPHGVFGHLRRRWNEYCGADLQMRLDITSCDLLVAAIANKSVEWDVRLGANGKRVPWRGFVGFVEFEAGSACSSLDLSNLAVLTR